MGERAGALRYLPLLWTADGWIYFIAADEYRRDRDWLGRASATRPAATLIAELPQPCSFRETSLAADARRLVCTVRASGSDVWLADNFDPEERR